MSFVQAIAFVREGLELGGPVVVILFAVSIVAFALIAMKLVQFSLLRVGRTSRARKALEIYRQGNPLEAERHAVAGRSAAAQAVALTMRLSRERELSKAEIEEEVGRLALTRLHDLQSGLRFLDAIAQLSPLLGLFGTVLGMIEAFRQLQNAGNAVDPSLLAGGIWVALMTTAAGLAVAMPVSLILTFLETRLEGERVSIETLVSDALSPLTRRSAEKDETASPETASPETARPVTGSPVGAPAYAH